MIVFETWFKKIQVYKIWSFTFLFLEAQSSPVPTFALSILNLF